MRAAHCSRISCSCPIWIRQRPNRSLQATSAWYARVWPMRNSSSSRTGSCCSQYARLDFEPEEVARACAEHYQPRFSGDTLPSTLAGVAVALADKLETLVGL